MVLMYLSPNSVQILLYVSKGDGRDRYRGEAERPEYQSRVDLKICYFEIG